ncbi:hypothetical protein ACVWXR_001998 [Pseudomonas lurida]
MRSPKNAGRYLHHHPGQEVHETQNLSAPRLRSIIAHNPPSPTFIAPLPPRNMAATCINPITTGLTP